MRSYSPIFAGELPNDVVSRWDRIRCFYSRWRRPADSPLHDTFDGDSKLIAKAKDRGPGQLSYSILQWFILAENARVIDAPYIRDVETIIPIEDVINDRRAVDATVILESGESDVYWAVDNALLQEPDPPVKIFQRYDTSVSPFMGSNKSVSEFVLKYLAAYNEHAVDNREWFSAEGTAQDIETVVRWFDYSLEITDDDRLFDRRFILLESNDAAAIVHGERLEVSLFCDPGSLEMPQFLVSEMEAHLKLRAQYGSR